MSGVDVAHNHEQHPLLATVEDACAILRCGRTLMFEMLKSGVLERRKLGSATRVTMRSIHRVAGL